MLKCIIVDDQPQAIQVLKTHIRKISFLECIGSFHDSGEALDFLKNKPVDLIFFDVRKSIQSDNTLIRLFQLQALVILTSSNKSLAYEAFENSAVDFLLKPVSYSRFFQSAEKAFKIVFQSDRINSNSETNQIKGGYIFIKEATRLVRLELDDIYYVMGLKNYVSIMTRSHRIVSLQTMKQMEELLPARRFIRVHRSYFVALDKIISIEKHQVHIKDKIIPIGNIYLASFMKKIAKISNQ